MITVNVSANLKEFNKLTAQLSLQQIAKATSGAINKTLMLGRTQARKQVKAVYNIPNRYMGYVDIKRARLSELQLEGHIFARSGPLPMDAFNPVYNPPTGGKLRITRRGQLKQTNTNSRKKGGGVTIEIRKGQKKVLSYAFLLPNAKPRVFARGDYEKDSDGRYVFNRRHKRKEYVKTGNDSVTNLVSVSVFGALINDKVLPIIADKVNNNFNRVLINAIERQTKI